MLKEIILSRDRVTTDAFGLEIGFIQHFNTRLATTLNYRAIANLHTLRITTAHVAISSLLCLHQSFPGNGFQKWRFFSIRAHFVVSWLSTAPTESSLHSLP
jgi:hypothetical protein